MTASIAASWSADVFREMRARDIKTVCTIPDGGLTELLNMVDADRGMRLVTLSTEEEGIGIATGQWLGGMRAMVAMQSSGVGNCINALGLPTAFRAPCLMLVTMRGQWGEFNPWQVPMGQATRSVLEAMGTVVHRPASAEEIAPTVNSALRLAYSSYASVAVLIPQRVIGIKSFQEQASQ